MCVWGGWQEGRTQVHFFLFPLHIPASGCTVTKAILVPLHWMHQEVEGPERDKGFSKVWQ